MARSFIRYSDNNTPRWGELAGAAPKLPTDQVILYPLAPGIGTTTAELVAQLDAGSSLGRSGETVTIAASQILSPVTTDSLALCQGMNYFSHTIGDGGVHVRKKNLLFVKASSSLCGAYDDVIKPPEVQMLDYEIEVGFIMRKPLGKDDKITADNIGDYLAGAVLCNDISARDTMFGMTYLQWLKGKSFRTFLPTGPVFYWLEKSEVAAALDNFRISLSWRNVERQNGVTSDMIFKPVETLNYIADFMDMKQGDLLLTGTPGGVIAKGTPTINGMLQEFLLDDEKRTEAFVAEAHATVSDFMQPCDLMTAEMVDERTGLSLGGQYSIVAT